MRLSEGETGKLIAGFFRRGCNELAGKGRQEGVDRIFRLARQNQDASSLLARRRERARATLLSMTHSRESARASELVDAAAPQLGHVVAGDAVKRVAIGAVADDAEEQLALAFAVGVDGADELEARDGVEGVLVGDDREDLLR